MAHLQAFAHSPVGTGLGAGPWLVKPLLDMCGESRCARRRSGDRLQSSQARFLPCQSG